MPPEGFEKQVVQPEKAEKKEGNLQDSAKKLADQALSRVEKSRVDVKMPIDPIDKFEGDAAEKARESIHLSPEVQAEEEKMSPDVLKKFADAFLPLADKLGADSPEATPEQIKQNNKEISELTSKLETNPEAAFAELFDGFPPSNM